MEHNAQRLAWSVLIAAFAVFCALVILIPRGIDLYLSTAMTSRPVRLDVIRGTVLWMPAGGQQEVNATDRQAVGEGEIVRTAPDSQALLSFFDGSNVELWPNTTIRIVQSQSSTYGQASTLVTLDQEAGHSRYQIAIPITQRRRFEVVTPQASTLLREGSYRIEEGNVDTAVTVTAGSATVSNDHDAVEVLKGESTQVSDGIGPSEPQSSTHNLLANGDFTQDLDNWQPGSREPNDVQPGTIIPRQQDNRTYVEIVREDGAQAAETFLHHTLSADVSDNSVLKLNFELRLDHQRLSDAGALRTEFPLIVRVRYRDSSGNEATWTKGYAIAASGDANPPSSPSFRSVQPDLWVDESVDLFDPQLVSPRPSAILWVEFAANGQGYTSDIANVQLLAD